MPVTIRAHFDGKVIVPDEPVDLPVNKPLEVELKPIAGTEEETNRNLAVNERLKRLASASGRISGPSIPPEALRRENLYEERA
jgi:hypothetical protein